MAKFRVHIPLEGFKIITLRTKSKYTVVDDVRKILNDHPGQFDISVERNELSINQDANCWSIQEIPEEE